MFENTGNLARRSLQMQDNKYGKIGDYSFKSFSCFLFLEKEEVFLAFYSVLHQCSNYCFTYEKQNSLKQEEQLNPQFVNRGL